MYRFFPLLLFFGLFGQLSVDQAIESEDGDIEVRGFLYEAQEGGWRLLSQPNVRSCCVRKHRSLELEGQIDPNDLHRAVSYQGKKVGDRLIITEQVRHNGSYALVGALVGVTGIFAYWRRSRARQEGGK